MAEPVAQADSSRYDSMVEAICRAVGAELLAKLRQPILLIDDARRIAYRNASADALLDRGDICYRNEDTLACRHRDSDRELTAALGRLRIANLLARTDGDAAPDRLPLRLRHRDGTPVPATLLPVKRPTRMAGVHNGCHALLRVYEPGVGLDVDPVVLAIAFDLTPAEARLAAMLANGRTPEQCAAELHVKMCTVRTQLHSVYGKTGAAGQAELLRMVIAAAAV